MKICDCCRNGEDCFEKPLEQYWLCESCAESEYIEHHDPKIYKPGIGYIDEINRSPIKS